MNDNTSLKATEVASIMNVSTRFVYAAADAGVLPAMRMKGTGGRVVVRFRPEDVKAYMEAALEAGRATDAAAAPAPRATRRRSSPAPRPAVSPRGRTPLSARAVVQES